MPRGAVEGAPAKPSSDRRSVALASVALVLAAAALGYVVHTLIAPPPAAPAAKPARDPAGRAPAGSPSAPGAAASAGTSAAPPPADPNPAVDIGVDVVGPVKTLAQPSAPGRSPAAGLSTARDVASSWSPTRVEDAMAKGFRPGRGVNVERRFAFLTDDMTPPELISKVEPLYPEEARSAGEEGSVVMEVLVERTGEVAGVKVVKGSPPFDEAASEAVKQWRFRPAMQDGRAVKVLATITVTFKRESTP
jgi:protein TonB